MAKQEEIKDGELVAVEQVLEAQTLREIGKGDQGQYINLVDIEGTKETLVDLAGKYKDLKVTKDNYKTIAKKAEQELRQSRYALQRINKGNNAFLNDIKKKEKELYEELIGLIKPEEERIYKDIAVFKEAAKKEKEEKERIEKERIEKIETALKQAELSLEKALVSAKTDEDLLGYDKFLEELKASFETFEEMEFQAKRIHAIYTAKRTEAAKQVEEAKLMERQKKELAEAEAKLEQQRERVYQARKKQLKKLGFSIKSGKVSGFGLSKTETGIKELGEVDWYEFLEDAEGKIEEHLAAVEKATKEEKERKEKEEREKLLEASKAWDELLVTYKGLGGDPKLFKLRKGQTPSKKDIEDLTTATRQLHKEKKEAMLVEVRVEIEPYKDKVLELLKELEGDSAKAEFKHAQSKDIVENFRGRVLEVVNEVFGEAYN